MYCTASECLPHTAAAERTDSPQPGSFDYWWSLPGAWVEPPNQRRHGGSGVVHGHAGGREVYVKRQHNHLHYSLRHPCGQPTAAREYHWLQRLRGLGIGAPRALFYGARARPDGAQAVLVTAALHGYRALAELDGLPVATAREIAAALGRSLGRLHRAALQHGCLYDKHVMIGLQAGQATAIALIDLEKMRRRVLPRQAAAHDLDQLRRHQRCFDRHAWAVLIDNHRRAMGAD